MLAIADFSCTSDPEAVKGAPVKVVQVIGVLDNSLDDSSDDSSDLVAQAGKILTTSRCELTASVISVS